jgi:hypothetical protein
MFTVAEGLLLAAGIFFIYTLISTVKTAFAKSKSGQ